MQLRQYQKEICRTLYDSNINYCIQLATGGGKTFTFSAFAKHYLNKIEGNILILVHREELLYQTEETFNALKELPQVISPKTKEVDFNKRIIIAMVKTLESRLKKNPSFIQNIHTIICDECHRNDFKKILAQLPHKRRIGFTATPVLMKKSESLSQTYNEIFLGRDICDLVKDGNLVKDVCYAPKGNKEMFQTLEKSYATDSGFTSISVNNIFTNPEMIKKVYDEYLNKCKGQKTVIFCCSVEHAEKLQEYFTSNGLNNSYVYHSKASENRKEIVNKFKKERDSILINVDVFTTGFDVPDVENIILARSTRSLALFLQIVGRGARPHEESGKNHFKVIDLGFNIQGVEGVFDGHGLWSDSRDWTSHFYNNEQSDKTGIAPTKECPECYKLHHTSKTECDECGYIFPKKQTNIVIEELELISNPPPIDIYSIMVTAKKRDFKPHWTCYQILDKHINNLRIHGIAKERYEQNKMSYDLKLWANFKKDFDKLLNLNPLLYKENAKPLGYWKKEFQNKINELYA